MGTFGCFWENVVCATGRNFSLGKSRKWVDSIKGMRGIFLKMGNSVK